MNKREIQAAIVEAMNEIDFEVTQADALAIYERISKLIGDSLSEPGGKFPILGVCNLTLRQTKPRPAYTGRNPQTGEPVEIAAKGASVKLALTWSKPHKEEVTASYAETQRKAEKKARRAAPVEPTPAPVAKGKKAAAPVVEESPPPGAKKKVKPAPATPPAPAAKAKKSVATPVEPAPVAKAKKAAPAPAPVVKTKKK